MYFWSPNGCLCAQVPTDRAFSVNAMEWSADGEALVLIDKDRFCVSFPQGGLQALVDPPDSGVAARIEAESYVEERFVVPEASGKWGSPARGGRGGGGGAAGKRSAAGAGAEAGARLAVGGTGGSRGIDRANAAYAEMHFGSSRSGIGAAGRSARY